MPCALDPASSVLKPRLVAGEQQRIGLARLFFRQPTFGVLDECTNAISVEAEEALYQHAADLGITLITVTQRAALLKYHAAGALALPAALLALDLWDLAVVCEYPVTG